MSGYIRKRGKRSWTVQVELPPDSATGERRRRTFSVHGNRKEAQQALTRALYERDHGVDVSPDRMTVAALLNRWLRDYAEPSVAPPTFAKYGQQARRVAAMIGSVGLRDLRPAHVQTVHARLREQGLSAQSVVHHHRVLRSALAWAMRMQLVATNPADSVKPPRVERHEMRFLDEADVARLLSTCEDDEQRRLIFVALQTGLRIGELMALRWSDVDFEAGRASVSRSLQYLHRSLQFRPTKTARGRRSISISSATVTVLRQQRGVQLERRLRAGSAYDDHDLIWGDELGRPKSPPAVSTRFMADGKTKWLRRASLSRSPPYVGYPGSQGGHPSEGGERATWSLEGRLHVRHLRSRASRHGAGGRGGDGLDDPVTGGHRALADALRCEPVRHREGRSLRLSRSTVPATNSGVRRPGDHARLAPACDTSLSRCSRSSRR